MIEFRFNMIEFRFNNSYEDISCSGMQGPGHVVRTVSEPEVTICGVSSRADGISQLKYLMNRVLKLDYVNSVIQPNGQVLTEFVLRVGREISWHEELKADFLFQDSQESK